VSSFTIPKGAKPGEMTVIRVLQWNGQESKSAAMGKVPKKRWASLQPATTFPIPSMKTTVTAAIAASIRAEVTKAALATDCKTSAMATADDEAAERIKTETKRQSMAFSIPAKVPARTR
jgi:hypothetical protein